MGAQAPTVELADGVPSTTLTAGTYNIQPPAGIGAFSVAYSVNGKTAVVLPAAPAGELGYNIEIPSCILTATIASGGPLQINKIK